MQALARLLTLLTDFFTSPAFILLARLVMVALSSAIEEGGEPLKLTRAWYPGLGNTRILFPEPSANTDRATERAILEDNLLFLLLSKEASWASHYLKYDVVSG